MRIISCRARLRVQIPELLIGRRIRATNRLPVCVFCSLRRRSLHCLQRQDQYKLPGFSTLGKIGSYDNIQNAVWS